MSPEQVKKDIIKRAEKHRDDIIDLARELVKTPSENLPPDGNELACQKIIHEFFKRENIETDLICLDEVSGLKEHEAFLKGRNYKNRPNVVAAFRGTGRKNSLLFSGHIDTVPAVDGNWTHPPFSADIEDGKMYGLGSYDMKAGLASMIMALKIIKGLGIELGGDLLFESVVDEENAGCGGTLANRILGHNADAAILAEPSNLDIYPAHKGFRIIHLIVKGTPGIAYAGEKLENPVEHTGKLIECIQLFREKRKRDSKIPLIYKNVKDPVPVFMPKLQAGEFSFKIPMRIPETCKLEVYWQTMPGETREDIEMEFFDFLDSWCKKNDYFSRNQPEWEFSHRWMPGTKIKEDHPIVKTVKKNAGEITHRTINITGAPYPCDLFIFNLYSNTPGIVFGPRGGNAHSEDEFVLVDDLLNLTEILACTAIDWCGLK